MEYSLTLSGLQSVLVPCCLNPYSNGILSDHLLEEKGFTLEDVLILILMEYSLTGKSGRRPFGRYAVLILILMEYSLTYKK